MFRVLYTTLIGLSLIASPVFAADIGFDFEKQLGMPLMKKAIPSEWKIIESSQEYISFKYKNFTITYSIGGDRAINMITIENIEIPDNSILTSIKKEKEKKLKNIGYTWNQSIGAYCKNDIMINIITTSFKGKYIYRVIYNEIKSEDI